MIADSQKSANVVLDAQGIPQIVAVNQTTLTTIKVYASFLNNLAWPENQVMVWQGSYVQVRTWTMRCGLSFILCVDVMCLMHCCKHVMPITAVVLTGNPLQFHTRFGLVYCGRHPIQWVSVGDIWPSSNEIIVVHLVCGRVFCINLKCHELQFLCSRHDCSVRPILCLRLLSSWYFPVKKWRVKLSNLRLCVNVAAGDRHMRL